jgi:hypothetical protein
MTDQAWRLSAADVQSARLRSVQTSHLVAIGANAKHHVRAFSARGRRAFAAVIVRRRRLAGVASQAVSQLHARLHAEFGEYGAEVGAHGVNGHA